MKMLRNSLLSMVALLALLATSVQAETKVELKGVHLCCGACVKAVGKAVASLDGVKAACDQDSETVTITAADDAGAQKALDALAAAGFHGATGNDKLAIKDDSGVKPGKVKKLEVSGVHNCCGSCTSSLKSALKEVSGATGHSLKSKDTTFTVEGDFDAAALVKALNDAGFHVKVK